jgi:hypothetical protein
MLLFLGAWLAAVWTLPLLGNPGWILAFGLVYAVLAGPAFGGSDVIEGCEEYSLALPPTRSERYAARLIVGGGCLVLFSLLDLLALGFDLSQALTQFYLDMGLLRPKTALRPYLLFGLVVAFPLAVFAFGFALAANARSRGVAMTAWFWGGVATLLLLRLGLLSEFRQWNTWTGYVSVPTLTGAAGVVLWFGHRRFCAKEIGPSTRPMVLPELWWLWAILACLALALAGFLLSSLSGELLRMLRP